VADRSRAESEARAEAEKARAAATTAEEGVTTAREVARAERDRQIAVMAARREAEQEATRVTVAAKAEREAATDHATARRTEAEGDADAIKIRAEAKAREYEVEAEGQRRINEARNMLAPAIIDFEISRERLRMIPQALAEAVKPLEKIGDVRIIDLGSRLAPGGGASATGGPTDSLLNSLLAYRANAPIIDHLLAEAGFVGANPIEALINQAAGPTATAPVSPPKGSPPKGPSQA
jgi:flotillin